MKIDMFKCFFCELELDDVELCRCEPCEKSRGFSNDICTICESIIHYPNNKIKNVSLKLRKEFHK